jgi:hypothetical protein
MRTNGVRISVARYCLTLMALTLLTLGAFAQSTTDGAIGGTVMDSSGAAVPNAKVTIKNLGTNAEQTVMTDETGYYRVGKLAPATYTVTINATGFADLKAEAVIVQIGIVTDLSPRLNVSSAGATVFVSSDIPLVNTTDQGFGPIVDQAAITNLPINGGRWSDFALLTPGVVNDSNGFGLLSFRGTSTLLNNNTVDGADNNQAFFSEERGRTRAGYSSAKAAVEEFQVNTSDYSAEYGRSAGGVVNTATKSGTNAFHGETYFYDRDNGFGATNAFTKVSVPNGSGGFTSVPFKPEDIRKIYGFGIGGPLLKDKLFFFFAFDRFSRIFPGVATATSPTAFFATPSSATINTLATRLGVTPAQAQIDYTNGLNGLSTELGSVPRSGSQTIFFPKIDWQINQKNHATFEVNRMRWVSPSGIQTQASVNFANHSFGNDYVRDTWGVGKLYSSLTPNISNEVRYQYGRDFEFEFAQPPSAYEQANIVNPPGYTNPLGLPPQITITNGFTFGVPTFLQRPKFPDERRQQVADTVSLTHGKHTLKFGFDFTHVDDVSQNLSTQYGSFSYGSLLDYFSDFYKQNACLGTVGGVANTPVPCYTSYNQAFGPLGFEFATKDIAVFAEDNWRILPRFTLNLGLRYEYESMPSVFTNLVNPAVPQTGHLPSDKNNLGPRIGFAWDIFGDGKTSVRGGYGMYFGRVINSTIFSALTSTGITGSQLSFSFSPTQGGPLFPQILASSGSAKVRPNIVFFDPNFQTPQIHEIDLTVEREIGWNTLFSVSYLGSLGRELPSFVDTNLAAPTSTITYKVLNGGPLAGPTYTTPLFTSRIPKNAAFGSMTDIFSGVNSSYHALAVQANHRMASHVQFAANYTFSHAIDFGQNAQTFTQANSLLLPSDLTLEKGNSIFNVKHRFVISAILESPWKVSGWGNYLVSGWQLAPIYQVQNGLPFSLATSGTPPGGISSGVNGSNGRFGIDAIGRNTFVLPRTQVVDLRLSKKFNFSERYKLELLAEGFNLFNHTNETSANSTGYFIVSRNTIVATPNGPVTCTNAAPCLNFNVNGAFAPVFGTMTNANSNFAYTQRQLQLGARFFF